MLPILVLVLVLRGGVALVRDTQRGVARAGKWYSSLRVRLDARRMRSKRAKEQRALDTIHELTLMLAQQREELAILRGVSECQPTDPSTSTLQIVK